jgi:hypothetical protein
VALVLVAATAAAALGSRGARASRTAKGTVIHLKIPLPGTNQARIDTVTIKATVKHGAPPTKLSVKVTNEPRLPAEIRVAGGLERPVRKGHATTFTLLIATRNLTGRTARVAQAGSENVAIVYPEELRTELTDLALKGPPISKDDCASLKAKIRGLEKFYVLRPEVRQMSPPPSIFEHVYKFLCP